jgi:hypothetical protein
VVFQLVRKLARAQFVQADRQRSERLWQEVAALDIDPDRVIRLLYGTTEHDDFSAMEAIDRLWSQENAQQQRRSPWRRPAWLGGGRPAPGAGRSRSRTTIAR